MPYLYCLPGLICGIALAVEDVRRRRVPRAWVAAGCGSQLAADLVWAAMANDFFTVLQALLFTALCAGVQLLLALARPGALGLGDVTAMLPLGLAVGAYGLIHVAVWWLAMGVLGIVFVALWTRLDPQRGTPYAGRTPFVPVIVVSGVIAVLL
ncbi:prepilin peptidase [Bifidobacterium stellenboschense]|uniref:Peptidase A24A, prepilin type IV n=1 Tax=Bifidobacterium stellenboschense TaxID=762211 RepID=A0A087DPB7_9BIFI|nr:prepilin peptidase [Bifidobacterium stellenboschense]KFI97367.1 peptidase A24A, prepilin type IV [Bifidobacterium stellenboschense]